MKFIVEKDLELRLVSQDLAEISYNLVVENYAELHKWMIWANENTSVDTTQKYFQDSVDNYQKNLQRCLAFFIRINWLVLLIYTQLI